MIEAQHIASSPAEAGINEERLEELFDFVAAEVASGLPSAQVAIGRGGKLAGLRTFGSVTSGGVAGPATDETLYCTWTMLASAVASAVPSH